MTPYRRRGMKRRDPVTPELCSTCKLPYGRTYEEHTGNQAHKDAVWGNVRGSCRFLVRGEGTTPRDIRACGRRRFEHPVEGRGRFENHTNFLP